MQSFEYKRRQKAGVFLGPTSSKITVAKEKERRKRKSEEEERRRREKSNGRTRSFSNGYFEAFLTENKKLLKGKGPFGGNVFKNPARYTYVSFITLSLRRV